MLDHLSMAAASIKKEEDSFPEKSREGEGVACEKSRRDLPPNTSSPAICYDRKKEGGIIAPKNSGSKTKRGKDSHLAIGGTS